MPEPWDLTEEEVLAERERIRPRLEAADREDGIFLARSMEESSVGTEDEIVADLSWFPPPSAGDLSKSAGLAGGIEADHDFPIEPEGCIQCRAHWSEEGIDLDWTPSEGVDPSLSIVLAFFDRDTARLLGKTHQVGPVESGNWHATTQELGFSPLIRWELQFVLVRS